MAIPTSIKTLLEYVKPKNVGLMFFSMEPDKFFPYTQIDVVQFPDGLGGNNIIEKTFKGPIHQQLREALQYIRNVVVTEKVVKHPDRAEADRFFNYPYAAIEEGLANAVYHRAYDEREPTKGSENEIVHETTYYGVHDGAHEGRHESRHEGRHDPSYDEQVRQLIDFCDVPNQHFPLTYALISVIMRLHLKKALLKVR